MPTAKVTDAQKRLRERIGDVIEASDGTLADAITVLGSLLGESLAMAEYAPLEIRLIMDEIERVAIIYGHRMDYERRGSPHAH